MEHRVEFQERQDFPRRKQRRERSTLVSWMMKLPFIRTRRQANLGMLLIMIGALFATYLVLNNEFNFTGAGAETTYIEDLTPEQREELPPEFLEALPSRNE